MQSDLVKISLVVNLEKLLACISNGLWLVTWTCHFVDPTVTLLPQNVIYIKISTSISGTFTKFWKIWNQSISITLEMELL